MAESRVFTVSSGLYPAAANVSTTAVTLATLGAAVAGCHKAFITVSTTAISYTLDGTTTPTASKGHPAAAGTTITLTEPSEILNFQCIKNGGADALVAVTLYKAS